MGYNVSRVRCISGELTITEDGIAWLDQNESELPNRRPEIGPDQKVEFDWSGDWSGNASCNGTLEKFFSFTRGTAEFVFTCERGDSFSGYRVVDGKVTEHEVEFKLGKEVKS